jgi:2-(1,2-epoxy-1,2-dihydrophenyl)acetyl-CoA isomerase
MHVLVESQPGFVRLTLARPAQRNALDAAMRDELEQAFAAADARDDIAAIVIAGQGNHFCAGGDVDMLATIDAGTVAALLEPMHRLMRRILASRKLTVAAVEGYAAGGGAGLAMACKQVVMARDAALAIEFHRIGLVPDCALLHTLPQRMGLVRAAGLLLAPRRLAADEALILGLADGVVDSGCALARAMELAACAAQVPVLVRDWIHRLLPSAAASLDAALAGEVAAQRECITSEEFRRGVESFLARRRGPASQTLDPKGKA